MARVRHPAPPRPELVRDPVGSFGWLEDRLLHDGHLARLGAGGIAVLTLLALAADRKGASFYGRARMAERLGLSATLIDEGLTRLLALNLVAFRPWRQGTTDGVWQLLPVPTSITPPPPRSSDSGHAGPTNVGDVLARLGFAPKKRV